MKKLFAFLSVTGLILCLASPVTAGGIDSKTNWSAEYVRTFNRNAATDFADIVSYNPAGTVKMDDGFYLNASVHYTAKDYANTYLGTKYEQDEPSLIPGMFALYKKDKWAWYGAITNTGGGGEIRFENGSKTSQQQGTLILALLPGFTMSGTDLRAKSFYLSTTLGGAYAFNNMFSVSLGARHVDASTNTAVNARYFFTALPTVKMAFNVDYDDNAAGWGGIIGLNIAPNDALNIGLRYETTTELNFKRKVNNDDTGKLVDGSYANRDLPALLGMGVSYKFFKNFRAEANLTYYFQKDANWEGNEDKVDNGYDAGITLEYTINPKWLVSVGYLYTDTGMDPDDMTPENPALNANTIGGGFAYKHSDNWAFNFAVGNAFYTDETQSDGTLLEKNVFFLGFGLQYKFK